MSDGGYGGNGTTSPLKCKKYWNVTPPSRFQSPNELLFNPSLNYFTWEKMMIYNP